MLCCLYCFCNQWALELSSFAKQLDPDSLQVKQLRYTALRHLGAMESTASGRNWYLTNSLEARPKSHEAETEVEITCVNLEAFIVEKNEVLVFIYLFHADSFKIRVFQMRAGLQ